MAAFAPNPLVIREGHFRRVVIEGSVWDYDSVHRKLRRLYRKPQRCTSCGRRKRLDWALRPDAEGYSLDVRDYFALCRSCHFRMDAGHRLLTWIGSGPPPEE